MNRPLFWDSTLKYLHFYYSTVFLGLIACIFWEILYLAVHIPTTLEDCCSSLYPSSSPHYPQRRGVRELEQTPAIGYLAANHVTTANAAVEIMREFVSKDKVLFAIESFEISEIRCFFVCRVSFV